ncbi:MULTISPECIES: hypothetical protein [Bacillus]|uniref:hypothetical protein n=1 Tax=Bacillus TaxID=1386 RepID=UPI000926E02A|nr:MULTISPECIES: hypothetical protein [Bacillus]MCY8590185.1 hypothetical protein [Bacillus haynesii]MEC0701226.1 hypothetical protein [Bacillus haynesii]OJT56396.1 hypothetical protein BFP47_14605 [Bacillus licheniformis]OJT69456.1 hypothetical protein BFP46_09290 [Bacillus licheniformis]
MVKNFKKFLVCLIATFIILAGVGIVKPAPTKALVLPGVTWSLKYMAKKDAEAAADSVPKKLKKSHDVVDLKKFKDKKGNTPVTKNSGTFKNGDWSIVKDTAGHIGYDGSKKKWKLYKGKNRKASLNGSGKIIDK